MIEKRHKNAQKVSGLLIAKSCNHGSFVNFEQLMNDEEFILHIAGITPNPIICKNYFYQYVNTYLKNKADFRLKFLKAIYLNENVYKLEDLNEIISFCGLRRENAEILNDLEFKRVFEKRILDLNYQDKIEYHYSGDDEKELHKYKVEANDLKVLYKNMQDNLNKILNCFVGEKKEVEEHEDFYAYMCVQARNKQI